MFLYPTCKWINYHNHSKLHYFSNIFLYSEAWFRQTKCMVMMPEERCTKVVNFMTPGVGVSSAEVWPYMLYCEYIISLKIFSTQGHGWGKQLYSNDNQRRAYQNCKFHDPQGRDSCAGAWSWTCNISSPLLVYTRALIRQIKCIAKMTKERTSKIVNLITIEAGCLC